ncbi:MAG: hypothetical protein V2A72_06955 [Candidatus Omnitrophota bacterium]
MKKILAIIIAIILVAPQQGFALRPMASKSVGLIKIINHKNLELLKKNGVKALILDWDDVIFTGIDSIKWILQTAIITSMQFGDVKKAKDFFDKTKNEMSNIDRFRIVLDGLEPQKVDIESFRKDNFKKYNSLFWDTIGSKLDTLKENPGKLSGCISAFIESLKTHNLPLCIDDARFYTGINFVQAEKYIKSHLKEWKADPTLCIVPGIFDALQSAKDAGVDMHIVSWSRNLTELNLAEELGITKYIPKDNIRGNVENKTKEVSKIVRGYPDNSVVAIDDGPTRNGIGAMKTGGAFCVGLCYKSEHSAGLRQHGSDIILYQPFDFKLLLKSLGIKTVKQGNYNKTQSIIDEKLGFKPVDIVLGQLQAIVKKQRDINPDMPILILVDGEGGVGKSELRLAIDPDCRDSTVYGNKYRNLNLTNLTQNIVVIRGDSLSKQFERKVKAKQRDQSFNAAFYKLPYRVLHEDNGWFNASHGKKLYHDSYYHFLPHYFTKLFKVLKQKHGRKDRIVLLDEAGSHGFFFHNRIKTASKEYLYVVLVKLRRVGSGENREAMVFPCIWDPAKNIVSFDTNSNEEAHKILSILCEQNGLEPTLFKDIQSLEAIDSAALRPMASKGKIVIEAEYVAANLDYFKKVYSYYEDFGILNKNGKELLKQAERIKGPMPQELCKELHKTISYFRNVPKMTAKEILEQFPQEHFKEIDTLGFTRYCSYLNVRPAGYCGNGCIFCPVIKLVGIIRAKRCMPYPLVVMLAKNGFLHHNSYDFEPLLYEDVCGALYHDIKKMLDYNPFSKIAYGLITHGAIEKYQDLMYRNLKHINDSGLLYDIEISVHPFDGDFIRLCKKYNYNEERLTAHYVRRYFNMIKNLYEHKHEIHLRFEKPPVFVKKNGISWPELADNIEIKLISLLKKQGILQYIQDGYEGWNKNSTFPEPDINVLSARGFEVCDSAAKKKIWETVDRRRAFSQGYYYQVDIYGNINLILSPIFDYPKAVFDKLSYDEKREIIDEEVVNNEDSRGLYYVLLRYLYPAGEHKKTADNLGNAIAKAHVRKEKFPDFAEDIINDILELNLPIAVYRGKKGVDLALRLNKKPEFKSIKLTNVYVEDPVGQSNLKAYESQPNFDIHAIGAFAASA